jgi:hypothetical protein
MKDLQPDYSNLFSKSSSPNSIKSIKISSHKIHIQQSQTGRMFFILGRDRTSIKTHCVLI